MKIMENDTLWQTIENLIIRSTPSSKSFFLANIVDKCRLGEVELNKWWLLLCFFKGG